MFNLYPYKNLNDFNLDYILKTLKQLKSTVETFIATETVTFADPILWNVASQYAKNTIVLSNSGDAYLSKQAVPVNIQLDNTDYWQEIFNFADYVRTANSNLTFNIEQGTTRATHAYAVDAWLLWDDVLYKVTSAIAIDDLLVVDTNIVHFTVEDFIKAFMTWATNTIQQYKNDIDASELLYRQQLAGDIANTTASLQAQLDLAIAGATVDSEVINARLGADGVTYATLGDAIRTQITHITNAMESHLYEAEGVGSYFYPFDFEVGKFYVFENVSANASDTVNILTCDSNDATVETIAYPLNVGERILFTPSASAVQLKIYNATANTKLMMYYGLVSEMYEGLHQLKDETNLTSPGVGGHTFPYTMQAGRHYIITNLSDNTVNMWTRDANDVNVEEIKQGVVPNEVIDFVPSATTPNFRVYFSSANGGTINIVSGDVVDNTQNIIAVNERVDDLLVTDIVSSTQNGGQTYAFDIVEGNDYTFKNNSNDVVNLYTWNADNTVAETIRMGLVKDGTLIFHASKSAPKLRVYYADASGGEVQITRGIINNIETKIIALNYPVHLDFEFADIPTITPSTEANVNDLYSLYDGLLATYPDWITKIDCSDADSILGITRPAYLSGLPIYIYKFSPTRIASTDDSRRLKVFIQCGTHPNEKMGIYTVYHFMKMLAEDWKDNKTFGQLRTMVDFYVMPCLSPWGYDNNSRVNYNGVNLNRNFPTLGWFENGYGTPDYTGPTAASEYETKIAVYYLNEIKPDVFFDAHTGEMPVNGTYGSVQISLNASASMYLNLIGMARFMTNEWIENNTDFPQDADTSLFDVMTSGVVGMAHIWAYENITHVSVLTEQTHVNNWSNGVLQPTPQETDTSRIWTENLKAVYNTILWLIDAACDLCFITK